MKNKVLKQMLAFSLAVALVGGNSVATFAAEPTNGTESSANTQAATDATEATATFSVEKAKGYFSDFPDQDTSTQRNLQEQDHIFPSSSCKRGICMDRLEDHRSGWKQHKCWNRICRS